MLSKKDNQQNARGPSRLQGKLETLRISLNLLSTLKALKFGPNKRTEKRRDNRS